MNQTQKSSDVPLSLPNIPASGQELYDSIMGDIEPELTTKELPLLKERYMNETPEQNKERAERHVKALQNYKEVLGEKERGMKREIKDFSNGTLELAEEMSSVIEEYKLGQLEEKIESTTNEEK